MFMMLISLIHEYGLFPSFVSVLLHIVLEFKMFLHESLINIYKAVRICCYLESI